MRKSPTNLSNEKNQFNQAGPHHLRASPRLIIRPKEVGDGAITSAAVAETWEELNRWMRWAENKEAFTAELLEIRNRQVMAGFLQRQSIELIGIETQTGKAVV